MTIEERNQLIEDNIKLAPFAARKCRNILPFAELEELVSIAQLVMVEATDKYKPEAGEYSNFIMHCVMLRFMRIKTHDNAKAHKSPATVSLDYTCITEQGERCLHNVIPAPSIDIEADIDTRTMIAQMFRRLNPQEANIIQLHYLHDIGYDAIAESYGFSHQRAQQIAKKGLAKMARAGYHDSEYAQGRKQA